MPASTGELYYLVKQVVNLITNFARKTRHLLERQSLEEAIGLAGPGGAGARARFGDSGVGSGDAGTREQLRDGVVGLWGAGVRERLGDGVVRRHGRL